MTNHNDSRGRCLPTLLAEPLTVQFPPLHPTALCRHRHLVMVAELGSPPRVRAPAPLVNAIGQEHLPRLVLVFAVPQVGPQEELDWMQALADERNRVKTLERKVTTQAGFSATLEAKLNLVIAQVQSLTEDMGTIKPKVEKTEQNLLDACANIVDRYVLASTHQESVTLLQSQLDAMVVELGNIACAAAPKAYEISTPTPARPQPPLGVEDPMQGGNDPWLGTSTSSNQQIPGSQPIYPDPWAATHGWTATAGTSQQASNQPAEVPGVLNCVTGTQKSPFMSQTQASQNYREACEGVSPPVPTRPKTWSSYEAKPSSQGMFATPTPHDPVATPSPLIGQARPGMRSAPLQPLPIPHGAQHMGDQRCMSQKKGT